MSWGSPVGGGVHMIRRMTDEGDSTEREGKVRLGGALDAALVGVVLSSLLSGCYSLAAAIQDPRLPPGTSQAVPDGLLVDTWRNDAGGSSTFAADGSLPPRTSAANSWTGRETAPGMPTIW